MRSDTKKNFTIAKEDRKHVSCCRYFALIPAAGTGTRFGSHLPKQYVPLLGKAMLQYALEAFAHTTSIAHIFVSVAPDDVYIADFYQKIPHLHNKITLYKTGGLTRHETVKNTLAAMTDSVQPDDWVLVHDAARPGITSARIEHLIKALQSHPVGGLFALPLRDTLKRAKGQESQATLARENLWCAQTPQMFRYGLLQNALACATLPMTDEAQAMEYSGKFPRLVLGDWRHFKVTFPEDHYLAELFLEKNLYTLSK